MDSSRRKNNSDENDWVDTDELMKGIKPGEGRMIGDTVCLGEVLLVEVNEPIKRPGKPKRKKKK